MPRRSFDDGYWGDTFVQELNKDAKLLFAYLWTNKRCNSAGLYEITSKTMAFETGIEMDELPELLDILSPKVKWIKESNIVWVKNFLKHQPLSPLFLKSVADCLSKVASNPSNNGVVKEYATYYGKLGVSIGFSNGLIMVSKGFINQTEPELEQDIEQELDNKGRGDLVKQVFAGIDKLRGYRPPKRNAEAASIIRMLKKYTPKQIIETWQTLKQDKFWVDKELYMMSVESQIGAVRSGTHTRGARKDKEQSDDSSKYISGQYGRKVRH